MNEIFLALHIEEWKPLLSTVLLSPLPLLVLIVVGARLMFRHRITAWFIILFSVASLWLTMTEGFAQALKLWLVRPPPVLMEADIAGLKRAPKTAIVVLGGGAKRLSPEYGVSNLKPASIERLRYGLWLSRETNLPVAFSGGVGYGAEPGMQTEADIAARIAEREFGRPLKWTESDSRDTRENAIKTVALLQGQGIEQIVLVTQDYHMRRSLRNFERAAEGRNIRIVPAPMGQSSGGPMRAYDWLPSRVGYESSWLVLHEWVGLVAGA
jgi:uncharacterized SAM-binding protein YcdF (DUF218 family)